MIIQVNKLTGKIVNTWETAQEAENASNSLYCASHITKCIRGKRKSHRGCTWKNAPEDEGFMENRTEDIKDGGLSKILTAKTEQVITSLEEAISFFEINTGVWDVERYLCNAWDVSMKSKVQDKAFKSTNYQVKVWLKKKESPVVVTEPTAKRVSFDLPPQGDNQMWLVIGCLHRPFHHKALWNAIMRLINDQKNNITGLIINGDYLDLRSLSSHDDYIPEGMDLGYEYSDGLQGISEIEEAFGDRAGSVDKVFQYGNHEDRYVRYVKANPRFGSALPSPTEALRLREYGYTVIEDWKDGYTRLGDNLDVFHGQYYSKNNAVKHLEMIPENSCLYNHTHRVQSYSNGRSTAYNIGWLGDAESDGFKYSNRFTRSAWQNAFAIVYVDHLGKSFVNTIESTGDGFFFGGKHY